MPSSQILRPLRLLLDVLWPLRCASCGATADADDAEGVLCTPCAASLVPGTGAICPRCGLVRLDPPEPGDHTCGACLKEPPRWSRARAAYAYGAALQDAIRRWKNAPDPNLGPRLGALMSRQAAEHGWPALPPETLVVPVPSPFRALLRRGFNPAGVLASTLARRLRLRHAPTALRLRRAPKGSRGLGKEARRRRLAGLLRARPEVVRGRPVLLVDDVMTTGATARAATAALLRAGARSVEVAVLARVPPR